MKARLLLLVMLVGCGPTWDQVVRHPDGTIEDPETGECWRNTPEGSVPVECPSDRSG
jgi:hypothetical protein